MDIAATSTFIKTTEPIIGDYNKSIKVVLGFTPSVILSFTVSLVVCLVCTDRHFIMNLR